MKSQKCLMLLMLLSLAGCAQSPAILQESGAAMSTGVFQELNDGDAAPRGFSDLTVSATVKTHKPGLFAASDVHGTEDYTMRLSIDGQTVHVGGNPQVERLGVKGQPDPEAGTGMRYRFRKTVRLKPGSHRIIVALPADGIAVEKEVNIAEGKLNILVVEPVYGRILEKRRPTFDEISSFEEGVSGMKFTLNGKGI